MKKSENEIVWKKGELIFLKVLLAITGIILVVDAYLWIDTVGFTFNLFAL